MDRSHLGYDSDLSPHSSSKPNGYGRDTLKMVRQVQECLSDSTKRRALDNQFQVDWEGDSRVGKTKIPIQQVQEQLKDLGVNTAADTGKFHELFGREGSEITFSQLQSQTAQYAKQLDAVSGNHCIPRAPMLEGSTTHMGDYVGCRKLKGTDLRTIQESTPFGHDLRDLPEHLMGVHAHKHITPRARMYKDNDEVAWKKRLDPNDKRVDQRKRGHVSKCENNRNHVDSMSNLMDWDGNTPVPTPAGRPDQYTLPRPTWLSDAADTYSVGPLG